MRIWTVTHQNRSPHQVKEMEADAQEENAMETDPPAEPHPILYIQASFPSTQDNRGFDHYQAFVTLAKEIVALPDVSIPPKEDSPAITSDLNMPARGEEGQYSSTYSTGNNKPRIVFGVRTGMSFPQLKREIFPFIDNAKIYLDLQPPFAKTNKMVTTGVIVMKHPYMTHIQSLMASFRQQWADNLQSEAMGITMRRAMPARWWASTEVSPLQLFMAPAILEAWASGICTVSKGPGF